MMNISYNATCHNHATASFVYAVYFKLDPYALSAGYFWAFSWSFLVAAVGRSTWQRSANLTRQIRISLSSSPAWTLSFSVQSVQCLAKWLCITIITLHHHNYVQITWQTYFHFASPLAKSEKIKFRWSTSVYFKQLTKFLKVLRLLLPIKKTTVIVKVKLS